MIALLTPDECKRKAKFAFKEISHKDKLAHPATNGLAQQFAENFLTKFPPQNAILITQAFDIWPSSENWELFKLLRDSQRLHSSLEEYPGELYESLTSSEAKYLVQRLCYALTAFHDFAYRDLYRGKTLWASHDEWITLSF